MEAILLMGTWLLIGAMIGGLAVFIIGAGRWRMQGVYATDRKWQKVLDQERDERTALQERFSRARETCKTLEAQNEKMGANLNKAHQREAEALAMLTRIKGAVSVELRRAGQ